MKIQYEYDFKLYATKIRDMQIAFFAPRVYIMKFGGQRRFKYIDIFARAMFKFTPVFITCINMDDG